MKQRENEMEVDTAGCMRVAQNQLQFHDAYHKIFLT